MKNPGGERVLCLARSRLPLEPAASGFVEDRLEAVLAAIRAHGVFLPRARVEEDDSYRQIIPFLVFRHRGRYFLTKRLRASSEKRLRQRYSLGLGGHVNAVDATAGDALEEGLRREWGEEVEYAGGLSRRLVGLLLDDSSPVSRVHLGLVHLVEGDSDQIRIREVEKLSGELLTPDEMRLYYLDMESWSQMVYDRVLAGPL